MNNIFRLLKLKISEELFFFLAFSLFIFPFVPSILAQNSDQIKTLELDKTIERELIGGQKNDFEINLGSKQYAKLIVGQRGIDVVVRLLDTAESVIVEYDAEPRITGDELIELISNNNGNIHLTVEPKQKSAKKGRYEIRLVELRLAAEKEIAVDETRKMLTEANRLWRAGKNAEALPIAQRAFSIREKELGAENSDTGQAVFTVANIYSDLGEFDKAESLFKRALEIKEKALGKDHISIASILNNLGVLYKDKGDFVKAESLYQRVLEIREKNLEPDHLLIAGVLNNLAGISREKGNFEKAEIYYKRALQIRENALGLDNPDVATSLNNLANLYDDPTKAEPLYKRALAIKEKFYGAEHQEVAQPLYNLAILYVGINEFAKAEPLCLRALSIVEKTLGTEHPFTSYPVNLLAQIYKNTGDYEKAETLYKRAIAIKEKTLGAYHPHLAGTYLNLANLYAVKGDIDKAIENETRGNEILEYNIALNLAAGSENDKFEYLRTLDYIENQTLSLNFLTAKNSQAATNLAVTTVFRRKGRVLDAMSDSLSVLRRRFDKQDQVLLDNLNNATAKLVSVVMEGPKELKSEEYEKKIKSLEQQRENVEAQISQKSAGSYEKTKPVLLNDIQELVPKDTVLIEFAVYTPRLQKGFEFGMGAIHDPQNTEKAHYAAFIVSSNGEIRAKDLGEINEINRSINEFRSALRDPQNKNVKQIGRTVDEKLMQPIRTLMGDAKHLLISPDGNLNLIPFEALVDEKGKYLIENYQFTYLTSGRDLLRMQTARKSKSNSMIIANPLFGEPSNQLIAGIDSGKDLRKKSRNRQSITATRDLSETYFAPLGGTLQEARSIKTLFPDATFLTEALATETALKQVSSPKILHIATHGFFLQDTVNALEKSVEPAKRKTDANSTIENPLLRSGLAFAGANERKKGADDGILTALEASGLNLWGTKLVVLSACETGLGEVINGEGVYGLRRAFVLAGTESLVMSLWSVSDYTTRELMTNYYKNLKQGLGRGEALRQVQLEMLKKNGREHPFFWASFIQSGEWANLDGVR